MKKPVWALVLGSLILASVAPQAAATEVAVVDISYIITNHGRYKRLRATITDQVKQVEGELRKQFKKITEERKKLQQYRQGTPEYRNLERKIARMVSDLNVSKQLERKKIADEDAQRLLQAYQEITGVVKSIADRYKISLVVNFDSNKLDPYNKKQLRTIFRRFVIYQNKRDITKLVLNELSRRYQSSASRGTNNTKR